MPASAFFPKLGEVAHKVTKQVKSLTSFQAILTFPEYPNLSCNLWVKGNAWRQELLETEGETPRVVQAMLGNTSSLLEVFPTQERGPLPWLVVWAFSLDKWASLGMNTEIMSYQFLLDRPCIVIGAGDGERDATQYWMDLEREIPVRVLWRAGSGLSDLVWDKCSRVGNFWLPHRMWFTLENGTPLEVTIRWNGINISLNNALFSRSAFVTQFAGKQMYPSVSPLLQQLGLFPLAVSIHP